MSNELDDLLASAVAHANQAQTIAKARKTAVTSRPGSVEFDEANAYVKQWERENLWRFSHDEVLIVRETCQCGATHESVQGLFNVYQHIQHPDRIDKRAALCFNSKEGRKRTFVHEITNAVVCISCYQTKGFPGAET